VLEITACLSFSPVLDEEIREYINEYPLCVSVAIRNGFLIEEGHNPHNIYSGY
jgi:hypothetical protein